MAQARNYKTISLRQRSNANAWSCVQAGGLRGRRLSREARAIATEDGKTC